MTMKAIRNSGTSFGWEIDSYRGCGHGCLYCYARLMKRKRYQDWTKPTPKSQVVGDLMKDIKRINDNPETRAHIRDTMLCACTDGYQDIECAYDITRQVVAELIANDLPFTVLTKNSNVLRDINLFKRYGKCRVGFTIITLDDDFRKLLEPNTSTIADRCDALRVLRRAGVSTYCSVEPIMPDERSNPIAIVNELKDCVDLFEFGKWNPKLRSTVPVKYDEGWYVDTFQKLNEHCDKLGIEYCHAGHSKEFLEKNGFEFRPYPVVLGEPTNHVHSIGPKFQSITPGTNPETVTC